MTKVNFKEGIIPDEDLQQIKEKQSAETERLIDQFKPVRPSRYPILVAKIIEDDHKQLKTVFYIEALKGVFDRAGSRPIICVSCLGRYQTGKTSTIAGLTGNWAHMSGDSINEQTDGVTVDGPYELDDFYKRFEINMPKDLFFTGNKGLTPLIFFFDIEGYGGMIHGVKSDVNNSAYIKLCTPFLCISSAFFLMSHQNPDRDEIEKILNVMQISNLTIKSDLKGNGLLKLIIGVTNYGRLLKRRDQPTKKTVEIRIKTATNNLKSGWRGCDMFKEKGILISFSPIVNPANANLFHWTFEFFAQQVNSTISKTL